jgi:hypothetical protein
MFDTIITKLTAILQDYNISSEQISNVTSQITPNNMTDLPELLPSLLGSTSLSQEDARSIINNVLADVDSDDEQATDHNMIEDLG